MGKVSKWQEKRGKNGKKQMLADLRLRGRATAACFFCRTRRARAAQLDLDEDEYTRYVIGKRTEGCPYYRDGDEYRTVRKQI